MAWVLFYTFITLLVLASCYLTFRGIPRLFSSEPGFFIKLTGGFLGCIGIAGIIWAIILVDRSSSYPERENLKSCAAKLEQIYRDIENYRQAFNGEMPPSLEAMVEHGYMIQRDLICPAGRPGKGSEKEVFKTEYAYIYNRAHKTIIAWDGHTHTIPHKVLRFLQKPGRNVLYSDGEARFIADRDFMKIQPSVDLQAK